MKRTTNQRIINAVIGFVLGAILVPFAVALLPLGIAWFMWNETDEGLE